MVEKILRERYGDGLAEVATRHMAAGGLTKGATELSKEERRAVFDYRPQKGSREAVGKLVYVAALLIATQTRLGPEEAELLDIS